MIHRLSYSRLANENRAVSNKQLTVIGYWSHHLMRFDIRPSKCRMEQMLTWLRDSSISTFEMFISRPSISRVQGYVGDLNMYIVQNKIRYSLMDQEQGGEGDWNNRKKRRGGRRWEHRREASHLHRPVVTWPGIKVKCAQRRAQIYAVIKSGEKRSPEQNTNLRRGRHWPLRRQCVLDSYSYLAGTFVFRSPMP